MDLSTFLLHLLVIVVAAKLLAELSERIGVPPVVGEIVAGLLIGPSVLGLVGSDELVRSLGELGVLLLLVGVGLEMDLGELGRVGRAALSVATIGVVTPMVLGFGAMALIGNDLNTSLFVAAALTATSVGITARVFGDLRALATTEARIVLGAAVADDVMGLVVLTIVVRLVTQGSVSPLSVLGILGVAIGFLVVGGGLAVFVAPWLFDQVERRSRSTGTVMVLAFAAVLGLAVLADSAKLATIVGAFLAGLAFSRTRQRERIHRELASVGSLLVPIFFVQIGLDAQVSAFASVWVLRDAGILLSAAVAGKLIAAVGARGTKADGWMVGLGMLPRGEVGLIFATLGLQEHVLGQDLYASLLIVVLVTTLVTPPLLKVRLARLRATSRTLAPGSLAAASVPPVGGWFWVDDGEVRLTALPDPDWVLPVALDASVEIIGGKPSERLLEYLTTNIDAATWDERAATAFRDTLRRGTPRSWHFLEAIGMLDVALPELTETMRARYRDPALLDARHTHRWATLERLRGLAEGTPLRAAYDRLAHPEWLLLAGLLVEGLAGRPDPVADAATIAARAGYGPVGIAEIVGLVGDDGLLPGIAGRPDAFEEEEVLQLASHLDNPERVRAAFLLALTRTDDLDVVERDRMLALHDLVQHALNDPTLANVDARNLIERRRTEAMLLAEGHPGVVERIRRAPRAELARQLAETIVRHAELTLAPFGRKTVRVDVSQLEDGRWRIEVGARDRPGLLATITGELADLGLDVERATIATWEDGAAVESFVVSGAVPAAEQLAAQIAQHDRTGFGIVPVVDASVEFNDLMSPWHTMVAVTCPDAPGLLHQLAAVLAAAGVHVKTATVERHEGLAIDRFEVTGARGGRLSDSEQQLIVTYIERGARVRVRRIREGFAVQSV